MPQPIEADRLIQSPQQAATLAPLYCVTGDEALLVTEALDALRAAARQKGYTERRTLVMDARSDWGAVAAETQSVSLFGERKLLEIKLLSGKPGKTGGETLAQLAEASRGQADPDTVVVLSLPRLDRATRESKWAGALAAHAAFVEVPTIDRSRLPGWIAQRLARQNQSVDAATQQWIADKVEGNLLAAHQEIMKLGLLYPEGPIAAEDVERAVMNVARYDVFGLRDAMLAGDAPRVVRMLEGLRAEGEALPLVLWAVGEEIRSLARLAEARAGGQDVNGLMRRLRFFGNHERLALQALSRVPAQAWPLAVQHAHDVDRLVKGLKVPGRLADPWEEMLRLALRVAAASGARQPGKILKNAY
ncbi:DNA polymerase III subunit delta [Orrella sp. JC864]|uniref:DNA polymerase III subunit delta n=1 Tax=Orrella sp. JC864 TaxID=3120298 RepID=UPI00300B8B80